MTQNSHIAWTDHTFNPWWGCARVSPGCQHCYAEATDRRFGGNAWGAHGTRRVTSDANWSEPVRWNRQAQRAGTTARVFCASMGDVFEDHPALPEPRRRLWTLIDATPALTWQLLTKRPGNATMAPWNPWPGRVWAGTSVEDQRRVDERIPDLAAVPAPVRFLSCEPLLGPLNLDLAGITWCIIGGESGPGHRPMHLDWLAGIVEQCRTAGVAVFVKQDSGPRAGQWGRIPPRLRIREFPAVPA